MNIESRSARISLRNHHSEFHKDRNNVIMMTCLIYCTPQDIRTSLCYGFAWVDLAHIPQDWFTWDGVILGSGISFKQSRKLCPNMHSRRNRKWPHSKKHKDVYILCTCTYNMFTSKMLLAHWYGCYWILTSNIFTLFTLHIFWISGPQARTLVRGNFI